jgi:hypothetical protein
MKSAALFFLSLGALGAAESRDFAKPCSEVFPAIVQQMTAASFTITASDAAGGVLQFGYNGQPMVYATFGKKAKPFLLKYTTDTRGHNGLTMTGATFTLAPSETGCRVTMAASLAVIDLVLNPNRGRRGEDSWIRASTPTQSSGAAERQWLDAIK